MLRSRARAPAVFFGQTCWMVDDARALATFLSFSRFFLFQSMLLRPPMIPRYVTHTRTFYSAKKYRLLAGALQINPSENPKRYTTGLALKEECVGLPQPPIRYISRPSRRSGGVNRANIKVRSFLTNQCGVSSVELIDRVIECNGEKASSMPPPQKYLVVIQDKYSYTHHDTIASKYYINSGRHP